MESERGFLYIMVRMTGLRSSELASLAAVLRAFWRSLRRRRGRVQQAPPLGRASFASRSRSIRSAVGWSFMQ